VEIKQYFYSQIDTIISSTNPDTVYPSHAPHMVDMGCNKVKIKTNAKDIAMHTYVHLACHSQNV
jgi:hypothetical protein